MPSIVLVDHDCRIEPLVLVRVAAALQRQVIEQFAQPPPMGWGTPATIRAALTSSPARDTEWEIGLFADPDQPGALGYHDTAPSGQPCAKVFPFLDAGDGVPWSRTASHEVLELLADPMLALCFQGPDSQIYAGEVCDPVEAFGYEIDGVDVSDWVRPTYYQPPVRNVVGFDHLGIVTSPLQILAGGYNQTYDPRTGWTLIDRGQRSARQISQGARSRTIRRRYPSRTFG